MEILITEGVTLDDLGLTPQDTSPFFDEVDNLWGTSEQKDKKHLIHDDNIQINFNKVRSFEGNYCIGLGIRLIGTSDAPESIKIMTGIVKLEDLHTLLKADCQIGKMFILSKRRIDDYDNYDIVRYRIGKDKNNKFIIYLHDLTHETTVPIKIPRDDE